MLRSADHRVTRWKNGGGGTREVLGSPAGAAITDFDWRISIADVEESGPFSTFEGVDRTLVWLEGPAMTVTVAGTRHELVRHVPFCFDGGLPTSCEVPGGPTRDLNVMTRRGRAHATVEVLRSTGPAVLTRGGVLVLVTVQGAVAVHAGDGGRTDLAVGDVLVDDGDGPGPGGSGWTVQGAGAVTVIRLSATG